MNKTVGIYTLGCKVNQYESEAIKKELTKLGFEVINENEVCSAYIINTCTVTAESDRKARQFIRRAMAKNPDAYILVTGCFSQVSPDEVAKIAGVDYICGNTDKLSVAYELEKLFELGKKNTLPIINVSDIDSAPFEKMSIDSFKRTRAYIKIEDGCESNCTYCIIPAARGKIRSKAPEEIVREAAALARSGCPEIVLTGIETSAYSEKSGGCALEDLTAMINEIDGIERIRYGSLDPTVMREDFVKKIATLDKVAPHFHISLQSGCNDVLFAMKRKYNTDIIRRNIARVREAIPNVQFSTDIIVGFPGETDENFRETLEFIKELRLLNLHVFAYSKRAGTPAAKMKDQVDKETKKARSAELIALGKRIHREILCEQIKNNPYQKVLFETFDGEYAYGHTESFIEVKVPSKCSLHACVLPVKLTDICDDMCIGALVTEDTF